MSQHPYHALGLIIKGKQIFAAQVSELANETRAAQYQKAGGIFGNLPPREAEAYIRLARRRLAAKKAHGNSAAGKASTAQHPRPEPAPSTRRPVVRKPRGPML